MKFLRQLFLRTPPRATACDVKIESNDRCSETRFVLVWCMLFFINRKNFERLFVPIQEIRLGIKNVDQKYAQTTVKYYNLCVRQKVLIQEHVLACNKEAGNYEAMTMFKLCEKNL